MVSINYAFKEMISKIVYYGPGLSGKTTNLQYVFKKVPQDTRGELISLATDADRTLYFDFLPVNVGNIKGFSVKFQLYTVPGQVYYNATRKLVLRGVDGLVFVADSQLDKMDENIESLKNLEENLAEYGYDLKTMPFVIQYNKRDLPNIAAIDQLQEILNPRGVPYYEAVATSGNGVFATLKAISKLVIDKAQSQGAEKPTSPKTAVISTGEAPPEKPNPVKAAVSHEKEPVVSAEPISRSRQSEEKTTRPPRVAAEYQQQAYGDLSENQLDDDQEAEKDIQADARQTPGPIEKPTIVTNSDTLTNVVVSSGPEESVEEPESEDDIEETTEHAVLEVGASDIEDKPAKADRRYHPDILDADKLESIRPPTITRKKTETDRIKTGFDEDVTVVADPQQTMQAFHKPQMAESVKVKDKKKASLFGWLSKKKK